MKTYNVRENQCYCGEIAVDGKGGCCSDSHYSERLRYYRYKKTRDDILDIASTLLSKQYSKKAKEGLAIKHGYLKNLSYSRKIKKLEEALHEIGL